MCSQAAMAAAGAVSGVSWIARVWSLAEVAPALLLDLNPVVSGCLLDVRERQIAIGVRDVRHLAKRASTLLTCEPSVSGSLRRRRCPARMRGRLSRAHRAAYEASRWVLVTGQTSRSGV